MEFKFFPKQNGTKKWWQKFDGVVLFPNEDGKWESAYPLHYHLPSSESDALRAARLKRIAQRGY